jgi:diguanylate cyclase (GGDEF)-like protein
MEDVDDSLDAPAFRFAVRTAGVILLAAGTLGFAWALAITNGLSGPDVQWRDAVFVTSVLAAGFGALLLPLGPRTPIWLLFAFPSLAAALICAPSLVSRESTEAGPMLLVWPILFAAYLLPERVAWTTLAVSVALLTAIALRIHTNRALAACIIVAASLAGTTYIMTRLRLHIRSLIERLRQDALTDPLTGLANRRAFGDLLDREFARYERHGDPLALLAIDIDHFKELNDRAGHPAGDAALTALAAVLTAHLRRGDIVARTGGEEFAALLTDCSNDTAERRARALRAAVAAEAARWPNPITVSIGVAVLPDHGSTPAQLVGAADAALYAAKAAGRDTVATA